MTAADSDAYRVGGKILVLVFKRLGATPPGEYLLELLVERGLPAVVMSFGNPKEDEPRSFTHHARRRLASPWAKFLPQRLRASAIFVAAVVWIFFTVLREGRPKLIINNGLAPQTAGWVVAKVLGIPYACHVHEVGDGRGISGFSKVLWRCEGRVLRGAALLIFSGTERRQLYLDRYGLDVQRTVLAFNCPRKRARNAEAATRALWNLPENTTIFAYLGGLGSTNLLEEAITAVATLPNVAFLAMGFGDSAYRAKLKEQANKLGLAARVKILDPQRDKWEFLDNADVGFCVYRPEGVRTQFVATSSNKLMECLAAGMAVVTSPTPDFRNFLAKFPVGIAVEDYTAASIAAALQTLLADRAALTKMRQSALAAHSTELNYEFQGEESARRLSTLFHSGSC